MRFKCISAYNHSPPGKGGSYCLFQLLLFVVWTISAPSVAQVPDSTVHGAYFFEGDEVVFQFDPQQYRSARMEGKPVEFEDLDIEQVALQGDFEGWEKKSWTMKKLPNGLFQLRKPISDFNDPYLWKFKFVVNGHIEVDPAPTQKVHKSNFWKDVFGIDPNKSLEDPQGNARFFLKGHTDASEVVLSGSFNGWQEEGLYMKRVPDGWEVRLQLEPGRYEYKFIVDGKWMEDPAAEENVNNWYNTLNSVRYITRKIQFQLPGFPEAKKVYVAGSFNNWKPEEIRLKREGNAWKTELELVGGKHYYKFIVDGRWMIDPSNPYKEKDNVGNVNSILMVQ